MNPVKEKFHEVVDNSKLKYSHIREMLKERSFPTDLAQRNLIPEFPLILLHGYGNQPSAWKKFIPYFKSNGYIEGKNFFLFDGRGENETPSKIDIRINAKKLQNLIQQILTSTGCSKVNLVGHSMGGLISRWFIEQLGGNDQVHKLIMLGTPNHGSQYLPFVSRVVGYIDQQLESVRGRKEKVVSKIDSFTKETEEMIENYIQYAISENSIDHLGIAALQMIPGSEFLTTLGYLGQTNYYLITGIKGLPSGAGHYLPEGFNDGAVHAESVDLTNVPVSHKVTFNLNHMQLRYKVVTFNQIMNFLVL